MVVLLYYFLFLRLLRQGMHSISQFLPGAFQFGIKGLPLVGHDKIFARGPAQAFYPAVGEIAGILKPCKQRVQGTFQYVQVGRPHFFHDIARVGLASPDNGEDAELQYPFAHLALCIFNIHDLFLFFPLLRPRFPETGYRWMRYAELNCQNKDMVLISTMQHIVPSF